MLYVLRRLVAQLSWKIYLLNAARDIEKQTFDSDCASIVKHVGIVLWKPRPDLGRWDGRLHQNGLVTNHEHS